MFRKVVVGANESATAAQAVRRAAELVRMTGGELHLVTAYRPKTVQAKNLPSEFRDVATSDPADAVLDDLTSVLKTLGVDPTVHASTGDPADAVVRIAGDVNADLIVVGNKGMRGARRVLGSVPNSVAHNARCSVLILDTT
ncbi:MAG TPA: universal stress protein [Acidimicrobiales bacterium]|nr:universal stress protein [Acidimicrobiales bacterium]